MDKKLNDVISAQAGAENVSREKELLQNYVTARQKEENLRAQVSAAYKELESAKNSLVDYLNDAGKKSTGKYDDLGSVLITDPIPSFKVPDDKKDSVPIWVKEIGAGSVIKETIHHATLSSLFRERMDKNESIPEYVEIFYVPQVKYSKPTSA